jgi:hypothetical protein
MKLTDPGKSFFWIIIAVLIKSALLSYFIWQSQRLTPESVKHGIVVMQNDYYMFLHPVDTYLKTGVFTLDGVHTFAGRMPGYSTPYFLLRCVFDQPMALCLLIIFQIILDALSVYCLAWLAFLLLKHKHYFYIVFFIAAISMYTSIFDVFTLTESFAVSATVFFLYYLYTAFEKQKRPHILVAGAFLTWLIFLRPFLGLLILFVPVIIFMRTWRLESLKTAILKGFIFVLPFCIGESLWIIRNYSMLHKFVPLETPLDVSYGKYGSYRSSAIAIRQLISAWGGETGEFYDHSEASWFHYAKGKEVEAYEFKSHVFNAEFNKDSLIQLKKWFNASVSPEFTNEQKDSLNALAEQTAMRYKRNYIHHNKARAYFLNPFIRLQKLVFSNPSMSMPLPRFGQMNLLEKIIKLFYIARYFVIIILGFIAGFWMLVNRTYNWFCLVLISVPVAIILAIIFNPLSIISNRYFLCAYPVLMLFAVYFLSIIQTRRTNGS